MAEDIYIAKHGRQEGPFTLDDILHKVHGREISGETLAWKPGEETWRPLRELVQMPAQPETHSAGLEKDLPDGSPEGSVNLEEPPPPDQVRDPGSGRVQPVPADLASARRGGGASWGSTRSGKGAANEEEEEVGSSWLGICSLAWGVVSIFLWLAIFIAAGIVQGQGEPSQGLLAIIGLGVIFMFLVTLVAGALGLVGLFVDGRRIYSILGLTFNGLQALGVIGLMILGAMLQ